MISLLKTVAWIAICGLIAVACGDDAVEADTLGVGAECEVHGDCTEEGQACLTQFKGGYCGVQGCAAHEDCPEGSACVIHDDGTNYCFRTCDQKDECNANRSAANEANCSSSIDYANDVDAGKACVPPSD